MGIFDFFKKEKSDVEIYYEERAQRENTGLNRRQNNYADTAFRLTVQDVFTITNRGTVVTGTVEVGEVSVGDMVRLRKANGECRDVRIDGLEVFRKLLNTATIGMNVGVLIGNVTKDDIGKGDILEK